MIESLAVENYRSFESYRIDRLATVNLLVGRNNCGKTSLLEAVEFLALGGAVEMLVRTAIRRNEMVGVANPEFYRGREFHPDITHFFRHHILGCESEFAIEGIGAGQFRVLINCDAAQRSDATQRKLFNEQEITSSGWLLEVYRNGEDTPVSVLPVFPDGTLEVREARSYVQRRSLPLGRRGGAAVEFITTASLDSSALSDLWNQIIRAKQEQFVVGALTLIEESIDSIQFLTETGGGTAGILIGTTDSDSEADRRVPLGSFGEGMKRLLALAMALARTTNGILLVDEIDTGLHHSVLPDMWKLVIETAIRNNVQVFATTHSLDCLRGLDAVCQDRPDFAGEVLVHKLDRNLDFAVTLDAADFQMAIEQELEVR